MSGAEGRWKRALAAGALVAAIGLPLGAQSQEERLQALERQVAELRAAIAAVGAAGSSVATPTITELERRIELLAAELEKLKLGEAAVEADASVYGLGPAASKVYRKPKGVSIGGYGELVYQGFSGSTDRGAPAGKSDEIDLLRAVVYLGYKWNDDWILNTELEWEHAADDKSGEIAVELAYVDRLIRPEINVRAGLVLLPVGLLNELHEPTTFLGARRPGVESTILPTTWRENGVGLFGELGPVSYRTYLVNGLDAKGFTAAGVRNGRQKGSKAKAEKLAWVGRVDWTATPGLLAGASLYLGDSGQGLADPLGGKVDARTTIAEGHLDWQRRGWQLRALVAETTIDDVAGLNRALALIGEKSIGEAQRGVYVQLGYDLFTGRSGESSLTPFARFERYDSQAKVPSGFARSAANDVEILTWGLQWKPFAQVVVKGDFQNVDNAAGTGVDQFNLALGWLF